MPAAVSPRGGDQGYRGQRRSQELDLSDRPDTRVEWAADVIRHRDVLMVLARKDFQTRYKRATLGVGWAVVVPLLQTAVLAVIFSRVVKTGGDHNYGVYVLSGMLPFSYFSGVLTAGVSSIVDGSGLTDKVWFPRVILVGVPAISNAVGLAITTILLLILMPVFGVDYSARTALLIPGLLLVVAFSVALSSVGAAAYVYFRDVKFLVQASLLVWLYLTPIVYQLTLLHRIQWLVEANPMTGVVTVFHLATVGAHGPVAVPVAITCGVTLVLLVAGAELQRVHDRLFVDLL